MSDEVTQLRLVVTVPDFDAALAFYRDELGLPEEAAFSGDGTRVSILGARVGPPSRSRTRGHAAFVDEVEVGRRVAGQVRVAFEVERLRGETDRLARAGATVVAPPTLTPWQSLNARLGRARRPAPDGLRRRPREPARRSEAEMMVGRVGAPRAPRRARAARRGRTRAGRRPRPGWSPTSSAPRRRRAAGRARRVDLGARVWRPSR